LQVTRDRPKKTHRVGQTLGREKKKRACGQWVLTRPTRESFVVHDQRGKKNNSGPGTRTKEAKKFFCGPGGDQSLTKEVGEKEKKVQKTCEKKKGTEGGFTKGKPGERKERVGWEKGLT